MVARLQRLGMAISAPPCSSTSRRADGSPSRSQSSVQDLGVAHQASSPGPRPSAAPCQSGQGRSISSGQKRFRRPRNPRTSLIDR